MKEPSFPSRPTLLRLGLKRLLPQPVCPKLELVRASASKRAILQVNGEPSPESLSAQKDNLSPAANL
jgi:hypothetical protein